MLLQKLYLANATETVDIRVTDGKFCRYCSSAGSAAR